MTESSQERLMREAAIEYFKRADAGSPSLLDLFTDDVEIFFPKFGRHFGKSAFVKFGAGFAGFVAEIHHPIDGLRLHASGDHLIVEGLTHGADRSGRTWSGGKTPGGRFCSVFQFRGGLIARMFIYLDPDYLGDDKDRFHWGLDRKNW